MNRLIKSIKVPPEDSTLDIFIRDVVGKKSDTATSVVGTTASMMAYLKGMAQSIPMLVAGTTDTTPLATMDLWSITGGPVMVHEIFGIVGTVIATAATTIALSLDPDDGGTPVVLCTNTYDATADEVGHIIRLTKDASEDVIGLLDVHEATDIQGPGIVCMIGDILVTYGAASSGVINWYCLYTSMGGVLAAA